MGIGTSIFLFAVGAILKFAVTAKVAGLELSTVGVILMVVGALGLVISLLYLRRPGRAVVGAGPEVVSREQYVVRERDPL